MRFREFYTISLDEGSDPAPPTTAEYLALFEVLKPKASKTPFIRIGGDHDGAYLVPNDLEGIEACFSPGVNRIKYFEDVLTDEYGIKSHMCDFTCDASEFRTPLRDGMQTFQKKWLDVAPGEDNIALADWVAMSAPTGDLLLQMDIEGAEYRNILGTPDETLQRFRIIVLEVHGLGRLIDGPTHRKVIAPFFEKLAHHFVCVHAHPNNCCGDFAIPGTDIRVPNVLELTFVRTESFIPDAGTPKLPHPLDVARNVPQKAPLFLSDAWCNYSRPPESAAKMAEDTRRHEADRRSAAHESQLMAALALTMQSLQTNARLSRLHRPGSGGAVEVATGRPYTLSSKYGAFGATGTVHPDHQFFFHTGFGPGQFITVDLGKVRRIQRIEVTNRRDGLQARAKFIFAALSVEKQDARPHVFPMYKEGKLAGGAWRECGIDVPLVRARYVTITSPVDTALHFADLRVYAAEPQGQWGSARSTLGALPRRAARKLRRLSRR